MGSRFLFFAALCAFTVHSAPAEEDSGAAAVDTSAVNLLEVQQAPTEEQNGITPEQWRQAGNDTIAVDVRGFDQAAIDAYMKDGELDYDRTRETEDLWSERFWRWLGRLLDKLFGTKGGRWVWYHLHYVILIAAGLFLLFYFRKRLFISAFTAAPLRGRQVTVVEEDITAINLDALLAEAEQKQRWSLALRYHYLKVLRRLVDEGLIEWRPRNTDQDYLAQLQDPSLRAVFSELSSTFKWVWYGDAPVDERRYLFLKKAFEAFHQQHAPGSPSLPHRTTNATPKASATEATPSPEAPARKA